MAPVSSIPFLLAIVLPVIAAVWLRHHYVAQLLVLAGNEPPPTDYGTGTMFDSISDRYDFINRVLAMGMDVQWRQRMVQTIATSLVATTTTPPLLLDVATGTADVALLLAAAIPGAKITGVDPSSNMLHVGRQKVAQRKLDTIIDLQVQDAQDLTELSEASFDAATMAFGIRNVPDRARALCQIHRVLKPGACFCILEFSEPDETTGILGAAARMFINHVIPVVGGLLSGHPREYWHLQNSIKDFPSPKEFGELLEGLHCKESHGAFQLNEIIQMNFGSVQLYVSTAMRRMDQAEHLACSSDGSSIGN